MSFIQMFLLVFMVSCLGSTRWVRQGAKDSSSFWEGNLIQVVTGQSSLDDEMYTDLIDKYCNSSSGIQSWCSLFENLHELGVPLYGWSFSASFYTSLDGTRGDVTYGP